MIVHTTILTMMVAWPALLVLSYVAVLRIWSAERIRRLLSKFPCALRQQLTASDAFRASWVFFASPSDRIGSSGLLRVERQSAGLEFVG